MFCSRITIRRRAASRCNLKKSCPKPITAQYFYVMAVIKYSRLRSSKPRTCFVAQPPCDTVHPPPIDHGHGQKTFPSARPTLPPNTAHAVFIGRGTGHYFANYRGFAGARWADSLSAGYDAMLAKQPMGQAPLCSFQNSSSQIWRVDRQGYAPPYSRAAQREGPNGF